jgi:hypothetical protein
MIQFSFNLNISADEYLNYYRGHITLVLARCSDGTSVQFPAGLLRPFATTLGVRGSFTLTCDDAGKGAKLARK